jgi:hypothetical protein
MTRVQIKNTIISEEMVALENSGLALVELSHAEQEAQRIAEEAAEEAWHQECWEAHEYMMEKYRYRAACAEAYWSFLTSGLQALLGCPLALGRVGLGNREARDMGYY